MEYPQAGAAVLQVPAERREVVVGADKIPAIYQRHHQSLFYSSRLDRIWNCDIKVDNRFYANGSIV